MSTIQRPTGQRHSQLFKSDVPDEALLDAIANNDSYAFQAFYERHSKRVLAFLVRRLSHYALAEDIMNEVFLSVWRSAARFEGRAKPLTWLMTIARNQAISALRKQREITGIIDDVTYNLPDENASPSDEVERAGEAAILQRCIGKLSPAHRVIVELVYFKEHSVTEAAKILDVPANTVKTRMFYARKKLGHLLADRGVTPTAIAA